MRSVRRLRFRPSLGMAMCLFVLLAVTLGSSIVPGTPDEMTADVLAGPSAEHILGTDSIGRDVLARLLIGARFSIAIAIASTAVTLILGAGAGMVAGYTGGVAGWLVMRAVDIFLSVPALLVAIAVLAALGPSVPTLIAVLIFTYFPQTVRIMRAATLQISGRGFIDSARISRVPAWRIFWTHILPNARAVLIVQATVTVAHMLLVETILSFLGLGVQPPTPSLGFMISEGRQWMELAPWVVLAPGTAIVFAVSAFTALGHALEQRGRGRL